MQDSHPKEEKIFVKQKSFAKNPSKHQTKDILSLYNFY